MCTSMRGSITPHLGQADAWRLRVYLGKDPATGKERYSSKVFRGSKKQADKILNQMLVDAETDRQHASIITVEDLLVEWIKHLRSLGRAHTTIYGYEWRIRKHLLPAIGSVPISALTAKHLDDLYARLLRESAPATVRQTHAIIRKALDQAQRWGWVGRNVAVLATSPRVDRTEIVSPSIEQLRALIEEAERTNPQFASLIGLAAVTGARRGELLGLHWSDIDLDKRFISIRGSLSYTSSSGVKFGPTKTRQVRRIALDDFGVAVIERQRGFLTEVCGKLELAPVENPWLFFGEVDGSKPLHPDSISSAFGKISKKLGMSGIHFHSLRHFTATQLIAAGMDIRTVSSRLGHSDPSITLRVYSHVLEANDRAASDIMGRLLGP